jgi:hypothetical protein
MKGNTFLIFGNNPATAAQFSSFLTKPVQYKALLERPQLTSTH